MLFTLIMWVCATYSISSGNCDGGLSAQLSLYSNLRRPRSQCFTVLRPGWYQFTDHGEMEGSVGLGGIRGVHEIADVSSG